MEEEEFDDFDDDFDPLADDSALDADGDGFSNLAEYQNGTNPLQSDAATEPQVTHVPVHNGWWQMLGVLIGLYYLNRRKVSGK